MMSVRSVTVLGILAGLAMLFVFAPAPYVDAQRSGAATTANWSLHNLDLAGRRYSTMDQINPSNVKTLTPRWLFQYGIIDGVARLFFYQIGGESRSGRPTGWRWGLLPRVSNVRILSQSFAGPRLVPSGHHTHWDTLIATVSPRPVSRSPTTEPGTTAHSPPLRMRSRTK